MWLTSNPKLKARLCLDLVSVGQWLCFQLVDLAKWWLCKAEPGEVKYLTSLEQMLVLIRSGHHHSKRPEV